MRPFAQHPDGAADGGQSLDNTLQKGRVELFGAEIALRKLSDFANQAANLLLGFFDGLGADLGLSGCHVLLSKRVNRSGDETIELAAGPNLLRNGPR